MKHCSNCEKVIPEDAEFCPYCGSSQISNQQGTSYKRVWLGIIGIILLISIVFGGIFLGPTLLGSKDSNAPQKQVPKSNSKYYTVKLKVIKTTDDVWDIVGNTNAPDGSHVIGVTKAGNHQLVTNANYKTSTVQDGKFSGKIDGVAVNKNNLVGDQVTIYLAATKDPILNKNNTLHSKSNLSNLKNDRYAQKLTFSTSQITFLNTLNSNLKKAGTSKATLEQKEALKNVSSISYAALTKSDKFDGVPYELNAAKVLEFKKSGHTTSLIVYINNNVNELYKIKCSKSVSNIMKNNIIEFSGKLSNRSNYSDDKNETHRIPTIKTNAIDILS